jgi:hypothetical protein
MAENDGFVIAWPWIFSSLAPMAGLESVLVETLDDIMGD